MVCYTVTDITAAGFISNLVLDLSEKSRKSHSITENIQSVFTLNLMDNIERIEDIT